MGVTIAIVIYILVAVGVSFCFWDCLSEGESLSSALRNIVLIWGAFLATGLAVWRSRVAEKQAEIAQGGLLSNRYQRAVEMLGSQLDFIRIGGIHALRNLEREHPSEYGQEVWALLDAYNVASGRSILRNERNVLEQALLEVQLQAGRASLKQADHWWRRLRLWLKNLCKRS